MEAFGLPTSFGKAQPEVVAGPSKPAASRGGASGRGDRGVVGGGKRSKRGRGRGGDVDDSARVTEATATAWDRGSSRLASQYDAFNGGVKRSHNSDQARQQSAPSIYPQSIGHHSRRGRGGHGEDRGRGSVRGKGGGDRGRGGFAGSRNPNETFHGRYLKSSMWEDPWESIIRSREAGQTE